MEKWSKEVAQVWKNYIPPCRPSSYEIELLNKLMEPKKLQWKNMKILILGSTSEYRIWAQSFNCMVTVIDNSLEYHNEISKEINIPLSNENLDNIDWLKMIYKNQYDIIVGDLVIGNLPSSKILEFLRKVKNALKNEGVFFTKSFFFDNNYLIRTPQDLFLEYEKYFRHRNPFQFNIYNLAMYCTNPDTYMMQFKDMYFQVELSFIKNIISRKTFNVFKNLGWTEEMKNQFYMMPKLLWEDNLIEIFNNFECEKSNEDWAVNFPIYIIKKNNKYEK